MVVDGQGVFRGGCERCDCKEYALPATVNQKCGYCGHFPPVHWAIDPPAPLPEPPLSRRILELSQTCLFEVWWCVQWLVISVAWPFLRLTVVIAPSITLIFTTCDEYGYEATHSLSLFLGLCLLLLEIFFGSEDFLQWASHALLLSSVFNTVLFWVVQMSVFPGVKYVFPLLKQS